MTIAPGTKACAESMKGQKGEDDDAGMRMLRFAEIRDWKRKREMRRDKEGLQDTN